MGLRAHEMPQRFQAAGFRANPAAFFSRRFGRWIGCSFIRQCGFHRW